jgi:hypothetical protein
MGGSVDLDRWNEDDDDQNALNDRYALDEAIDEHTCCFPGNCLMPGEHMRSECHTAEMVEDYLSELGADQRESLRDRGV